MVEESGKQRMHVIEIIEYFLYEIGGLSDKSRALKKGK